MNVVNECVDVVRQLGRIEAELADHRVHNAAGFVANIVFLKLF